MHTKTGGEDIVLRFEKENRKHKQSIDSINKEHSSNLKKIYSDFVEWAQNETDEDVIRQAAWDLYWNCPKFPVLHICAALNIKPKEIPDKIGIYILYGRCNKCGGDILFQSRGALQWWYKRPNYSSNLCEDCEKKDANSRIGGYIEREKQRKERVSQLRNMPYPEYLQTPEWDKTRKLKLKESSFRCEMCNATGVLNVHHRTYENRGDENTKDLIVLCEKCHKKFHDKD